MFFNKKNIRKIAQCGVMLVLAFASMPVHAQDKLAHMAVEDRKMRAVDSVVIRRLKVVEERENLDNPAGDIYPAWKNANVKYGDLPLPHEYKIDLRQFHMPCDSRKVTSHYGYRASFGRNHYGTDIKVYVGDTIRAAFSGKIRVVDYEAKGYGNYVVIRHPNGLETVYGHMSKHLVRNNQIVKAGQPIGLGGNTGRSTGSHLHFETRFLGKNINPETLFDFDAADIKGDYYVYRASGNHSLMGNTGHASVSDKNNVAAVNNTPAANAGYTVVQEGETLYSLARRYNKSVDELARANGLTRTSKLKKGQIIKY